MNIFKKMFLVRELKSNLDSDFNNYYQTQIRTDEVSQKLAGLVYTREKMIRKDLPDLQHVLDLKSQIEKCNTDLLKFEANLKTAHKDSNYIKYWELDKKLTELRREYESAYDIVEGYEEYPSYDNSAQYLIGTFIDNSAFTKVRQVSRREPDIIKQNKIEIERKKIELEIENNPELLKFKGTQNWETEINRVNLRNKELSKEYNDLQRIGELLSRCAKNKDLYTKHDKEIEDLNQKYSILSKPSNRWYDTYLENVRQLLELNKRKYVHAHKAKHKEQWDTLKKNDLNFRGAGRGSNATKWDLAEDIKKNNLKLTSIDFEKLNNDISVIKSHYNELMKEKQQTKNKQANKETALNQ